MNEKRTGMSNNFEKPEATKISKSGLEYSNNEEFAEALYKLKPKVVRFLVKRFGIIKDQNLFEKVDDVFAIVVSKAALKRESFNGDSSLETWLTRIAFNEFIIFLRKIKTHPDTNPRKVVGIEKLNENKFAVGGKKEIEDKISYDTLLAKLNLAVNKGVITQDQLDLLLMKEIEEYSIEELSKKKEMNAGTVRVNLFRAKEKLRKYLQQEKILEELNKELSKLLK